MMSCIMGAATLCHLCSIHLVHSGFSYVTAQADVAELTHVSLQQGLLVILF